VYKGRTVAVVVPAHDEEALIAKTITTIPALVDLIVVVDDASTDETARAALDTGDPRLSLVRLEENQGVGGAIVAGHRHVLERGMDIAVVMAGDAQMDPGHLPALLDPICDEGYDFAKADRFSGFDTFRGMPRVRVLGNIVVGFLAKAATGYWHLFDPLNGYTAIRCEVLAKMPFDRLRRDYSFECDLLVDMNIVHARGKDVSVPAVYGDERSEIRLLRASASLLRALFVGFWRRMIWKYVLWSFSPIAIFLFGGLLLTLWGLGFGTWVAIASIGPAEASTATVLISVGPLLVGINLLIMGWFLDILEDAR